MVTLETAWPYWETAVQIQCVLVVSLVGDVELNLHVPEDGTRTPISFYGDNNNAWYLLQGTLHIIIYLIFTTILCRNAIIFSWFTYNKTKAQTVEDTCPRSHEVKMVELVLNPRQSDCRVQALNNYIILFVNVQGFLKLRVPGSEPLSARNICLEPVILRNYSGTTFTSRKN